MLRNTWPLSYMGRQFSPLLIPSLAWWHDASDRPTLFQDAAGTTPAGAGNVVGLWKDKSGNGRDFQSTSTTRPVLTNSAVSGISYLDFDGSNDAMQSVTTNDPCATVVVIATMLAGSNKSNFGLLTNGTDQTTNVDFAFTRNGATSTWLISQSAGNSLSDATHIWRNQVQTNAFDFGTNRVYSADGTGHPASLVFPGGRRIGNDRFIAGRDTAMRLYGLLGFSSILSDADRRRVERWASAYYRVPF
jgi:hypothetical protein